MVQSVMLFLIEYIKHSAPLNGTCFSFEFNCKLSSDEFEFKQHYFNSFWHDLTWFCLCDRIRNLCFLFRNSRGLFHIVWLQVLTFVTLHKSWTKDKTCECDKPLSSRLLFFLNPSTQFWFATHNMGGSNLSRLTCSIMSKFREKECETFSKHYFLIWLLLLLFHFHQFFFLIRTLCNFYIVFRWYHRTDVVAKLPHKYLYFNC